MTCSKTLSGLFAVLLAVILFCSASNAQHLRIYHIDVEQADATLIVSPSGRTLLVDAGKNGHGDRLMAAMNEAGVTQIDAFVCTHYHEDHYGGIDDLVNDHGVNVLETYDRGEKTHVPASKRSGVTYRGYDTTVGEDAIVLRPGDTVPFDPAVSVRCISSSGVVIGEENPTTGVDENDMSLSLLITYGGFRYFIGGDIERETEDDIAARDLVLDVDVHQANHHASASSSSLPFMQDMEPTVIIISNGSNGRYFHPRQTTLTAYEGLNGPPVVFQTNTCFYDHTCGNVIDERIGDTEPNETDGTIVVEVDDAAGTYTVSLRGAVYDTYNTKGATTNTQVVIESLLPNPQGADSQLEQATLRNNGTEAVSLVGWVLRDRSNREWDLSALGSLAAGQSSTIQRNGQPMSLNNNGDEIRLMDAGGNQRDIFDYPGSAQDVVIDTGH